MVRRRDAGEEQLGGSHYSWDDRCGLGGFLCYEYGSDSDTATNMANNIFVALLIAWAVAVVCGYAAKAGGRTRWSFYWVGALMVALCCVQYYFVFLAANTLPPSAAADYIRRYDCMYSNKGGKRNKDGDKNRPLTNLNPCWCHEHAICLDAATGDEIHHSACPTDGSAYCYEGNGDRVSLNLGKRVVSTERDCSYGRSAKCSKEQPCTPCEADRAVLFDDSSYCNLCSDINRGRCDFVPGVGPYCYVEPGSAAVEPCGLCCTHLEPFFEVVIPTDAP